MGPSLAEMHELHRRMESLAKEFGFDDALPVVSKGHEMRIFGGETNNRGGRRNCELIRAISIGLRMFGRIVEVHQTPSVDGKPAGHG